MNIMITPELIGIVITALISLSTCIYTFGGLSAKVNLIEKTVDKLSNIVMDINVRLGNLEGEVSGMNTRLGLVEARFSYAGNSPIQLTPVGQKIFNDINGSSYVEAHYGELKEVVKNFGMDTKYDVQQNSIIAVEKIVDNETLNAYKAYAYKEGKRLEQIFEAVGVYLRDKILEEQG